jgi:uncharacterized membrane protein
VTEIHESDLRVILYSQEECSLCDQVKVDLESLQESHPHTIVEIDIRSDPALLTKFKERVPVVEVGPYTLSAPFTKQDLQITLSAARDGQYARPQPRKTKSEMGVRLNRGLLFFTKHWVAFFNLFVLIYIGLPLSAPVLMNAGMTTPATWIYKIYAPMCHQLAYRSWFLFGEQAVYPVEAAQMSGLATYEDITGLDPNDLRAGRDFIGSDEFGYKVAMCQRDMAIWGGILVAGMLFGLFRKHVKPLPILIWLLVGIVPVALDGGTQLFSSLPILPFPVRESTPVLRTVTGFLFGFMNIWLAYPYVEESMTETQALVSAKLAQVEKPSIESS